LAAALAVQQAMAMKMSWMGEGQATVQIAGGGILRARRGQRGQHVFVRAGLIEGAAPELAYWEAQV
jgi:hypothetical protein